MKVPPFEMTTAEIVGELLPLRVDLSVAIVRAKNPFNVGAIIRVAHSFLVREIVLIGDAPYYERASMGMHKYETIVHCPTEEAFIERCRALGRPILGVERDAARRTIWETEFPADVVLAFGSEDDGLPASVLDACCDVVAVPMYGINHSYPVTVAAGMALCEWARRRDPRGRR
jgi:tRNA G18 (ribose-2'-O)-methylase SpoU